MNVNGLKIVREALKQELVNAMDKSIERHRRLDEVTEKLGEDDIATEHAETLVFEIEQYKVEIAGILETVRSLIAEYEG